MMDLHRVDPQVRSAIEQRTHGFLDGFVQLGIDSVPEIVSFENAEYVSRLLAVESAIPGYERDAQDRDIVLRLHQQICISGLLGKECAVAVLRQRLDKLRQTILNAETEIQQIVASLDALENQENRDLDPEDFVTQEEWAQYENAPLSEQLTPGMFEFMTESAEVVTWS